MIHHIKGNAVTALLEGDLDVYIYEYTPKVFVTKEEFKKIQQENMK